MATYQVLAWRGIPSQVKVSDDSGATASKQMPAFFQHEIDRVAMAEVLIDSDAYLEAWAWSEEADREGSAEVVAEELGEELAKVWRRENGLA